MGDATDKKRKLEKGAKLLALVLASLLGLIVLAFVALKLYLATSLPAPQFSRMLTSQLQQEVTVKEIELSGRTVILKGVELKNPAGFEGGRLFAAGTVAIAPLWSDLMRGRQRFHLISVDGGEVNLEKNSAGAWNFYELQRRLAARKPPEPGKPPPPETAIRKLLLKNGAITVQGQGVRGIDLQVFNLSSGGSRKAQVELAFQDTSRNRYLLKGTARPGKDAAVDLSLTAPSLSLANLAPLVKLKNPGVFKSARGVLQANAVLAKGELRSSGTFMFHGVQVPAAKGSFPVAGTLQFNGVYTLAEDTAHLNEATLSIDKMAQLHAEGSVKGVKKEREFALLFGLDAIDLALANVLVPAESRRNLLFGGKLRCESLRLEGSAGVGVESAAGSLQLRDGSLAREGQLIASGVSGNASLSRKGGGVAAAGRLTVSRPEEKPLLEALDLPFDLTLSSQLQPLRARSAGLSARYLGIPVAGSVAYDAAKGNPLSASLRVPTAKAAALNPLLRRYNLQAASGSASAAVELTGKGARELDGTARLQLNDFSGKRGTDAVAAKGAAVTARVRKRGAGLQAEGDARLTGLTYNGKKGDARFAYRLMDRTIHLEGVDAGLAGTRLSASRITAQLPPAGDRAKASVYPLQLDLEGGSVKQGELLIANLAGRVRGDLVTEGAEKWLEGTAELTSRTLSWQGRGVSAPVLHVTSTRAGARGELRGELLGGKVTGDAAFRPFAPEAGATFKLDVTGAAAEQTARLLPKATGVRPRGGKIDLHLNGGYAKKEGFASRFAAKGRGLSLSNGSGKAILSGAALSLSGRVSAEALSIGEFTLAPGRGVALQAKGEVARPFSPNRRGAIAFSLHETSFENVVETFINAMPRTLQEATLQGTVAANGRLELRDKRQLVEGGVTVKGGRVEVPQQKLVVAGVNGRLPFSLDLAGKGSAKPREAREFSRANYQRLLAQLRESRPGGEVVSVDRITLGTLEMGKTTLNLRAGNGLMEMPSLRSTLYDGALHGTGYLAMGEKLTYRGDLLVNGVSMRTLCRNIPNLEGYISGRVDGVISVHGLGGGAKALTGFVDLWAREGGGEKMLVSKEFLQRLAKQKLSGFFLSRDRPYDKAEIKGVLAEGDLTFEALKIVNTNVFGVRDLNVNIAPTQNRIALDHLLSSIKEAATRGKPATGDQPPAKAPGAPGIVPEFRWEE